MYLLRKYGTGTGADVRIPITKRSSVDFAVGADWTPAAGDVKVSKDGGAVANIATLPTALASGNTAQWVFTFSDSELTCKELCVTVSDSATKAVEDTMFIIETYGNASAMFPADLGAAAGSTGALIQYGTSSGQLATSSGAVNITSNIKKNQALTAFEFLMVSSSDHLTPLTGLTVTAERSIDGAAFGACANSVSEVASGIYKITLAAGDLNGNVITLKFTATSADANYITIITAP